MTSRNVAIAFVLVSAVTTSSIAGKVIPAHDDAALKD
jgi:hypothetical protein